MNTPNTSSISGLHASDFVFKAFSTWISRFGLAKRIRGSCSFTKCLEEEVRIYTCKLQENGKLTSRQSGHSGMPGISSVSGRHAAGALVVLSASPAPNLFFVELLAVPPSRLLLQPLQHKKKEDELTRVDLGSCRVLLPSFPHPPLTRFHLQHVDSRHNNGGTAGRRDPCSSAFKTKHSGKQVLRC